MKFLQTDFFPLKGKKFIQSPNSKFICVLEKKKLKIFNDNMDPFFICSLHSTTSPVIKWSPDESFLLAYAPESKFVEILSIEKKDLQKINFDFPIIYAKMMPFKSYFLTISKFNVLIYYYCMI